MGQPVEITRLDYTADELRRKSAETRDARVARRLLALALVLDGRDRHEAARLSGMDRQTLRDWVIRFNQGGLAALANRPVPGRPPSLTEAQLAEVKEIVLAGPDLEKHGVMRWRCVDLQAVIATEFGVKFHEATIGKLLGKLNLTRLQPRPSHPGKSAEAEADFKKNFAEIVKNAVGEATGEKPLEIWFQDEARVGQQGTLTYIWAERGSRPVRPRDCRRTWAYIFGAVCPARAAGSALVMPRVNIKAMNKHLDDISKTVAPGAHAALVVDGASWHRPGGDLKVPDNITLIPLPPYAPELNPVENIWLYLRANKLSMTVWESYEEILAACCNAWNFFINDPNRVRSITQRDWASVNA